MPLPRIFSSLKKKIAHFRLPCVCVTNANPISMKLGTVSLWCLCCGREMRYYNFISVVVIFPLKKKSVFLLSWTGPVKPDLFFERSFFRQKSPGSPDGPHKKLIAGSMVLLTNLQQVEKHFPLICFFFNQSCVVCALQYTREIVFSWAGLVLWLLLTGNLLRDWNLMCSHFFPFSGGRWNSHPALLPLSYMCLKIPPLLLDVNPQKSFPISVNFWVAQEYCFQS